MFREMRRTKQRLSVDDTEAVLKRCTHGVLACLGDENYPYAVPLSYVFHKGRLYFHSAKSGHKIDAVIQQTKVSFAVIDEDTIVSESFTSHFRSVIVFGKARIVAHDEWLEAFRALIEKYSSAESEESKDNELARCTQSCIIAIDIDHISGKEAAFCHRYLKTLRPAGQNCHHKILLTLENIHDPEVALNWQHLKAVCQGLPKRRTPCR